ncbi:MAG: glycerol-3-phosphate 1-O-acyltransferase PlsY [Aerococcus sp.]|nr:glycerol-3-phosphate 1-O-acyltransferase PlsY [Aerococcus sp.]
MFNVLFSVLAYLLGSIPFGVLIGKGLYHKDIRSFGSGNIGTTNAFRAFGPRGGLLVFLFDMLKGFLPVMIAHLVPQLTWDAMIYGIFAILGHSFSLYLRFKGGKAVATSFGAALAYSPIFALLSIAVFFIVLWVSRMVSLSSILALIASSILVTFFMPDVSWLFRGLVYGITLLIIVRHIQNIKRILNGTESKIQHFSSKKKR